MNDMTPIPTAPADRPASNGKTALTDAFKEHFSGDAPLAEKGEELRQGKALDQRRLSRRRRDRTPSDAARHPPLTLGPRVALMVTRRLTAEPPE